MNLQIVEDLRGIENAKSEKKEIVRSKPSLLGITRINYVVFRRLSSLADHSKTLSRKIRPGLLDWTLGEKSPLESEPLILEYSMRVTLRVNLTAFSNDFGRYS